MPPLLNRPGPGCGKIKIIAANSSREFAKSTSWMRSSAEASREPTDPRIVEFDNHLGRAESGPNKPSLLRRPRLFSAAADSGLSARAVDAAPANYSHIFESAFSADLCLQLVYGSQYRKRPSRNTLVGSASA